MRRSSALPSICTRLKCLRSIDEPSFSYWYECTNRYFTLTPLSVAERFREVIDNRKAAWVFTSATLAVNKRMGHFASRLGVGHAKTLILDSPFDYAQQALLCLPRNMPEPNHPGGARQLARMMKPLIDANKGRCFFLMYVYVTQNDA